jgi:hypothetical protein
LLGLIAGLAALTNNARTFLSVGFFQLNNPHV